MSADIRKRPRPCCFRKEGPGSIRLPGVTPREEPAQEAGCQRYGVTKYFQRQHQPSVWRVLCAIRDGCIDDPCDEYGLYENAKLAPHPQYLPKKIGEAITQQLIGEPCLRILYQGFEVSRLFEL